MPHVLTTVQARELAGAGYAVGLMVDMAVVLASRCEAARGNVDDANIPIAILDLIAIEDIELRRAVFGLWKRVCIDVKLGGFVVVIVVVVFRFEAALWAGPVALGE